MRIFSLFFSFLCFAHAFEYHLKPQKIHDTLYCFIGDVHAPNKMNNGNMVNTCYLKTEEFWIVIDSGPTYAYAKEAHGKMQGIARLPVRYVINTHTHDDHWLGNGYYASLGAIIYGPKSFEKHPNALRMKGMISKEAFEKTEVFYPHHQISTPLRLPEYPLELLPFQFTAHSESDMIIYDPKTRTLFAGDLVFNDRLPSIRDGDLKGWFSALGHLESMEWDYVIGGHGRETSKQALVMTKAYLKGLEYAVRSAIDEGVELDEIVKNVPMKAFRDKAMYEMLHGQNVYKAYQLLEWEE